MGVRRIRGIFLGVSIMRIIVFWVLKWGTPILGSNPVGAEAARFQATPEACKV